MSETQGAIDRRDALLRVLSQFDRVAIAVSGGVDSMTLAWMAGRQLGGRAQMFHAVSAAVPPEATDRVRRYARRAAWDLQLVDAGELADPAYVANPVDRCFFCKMDLYGAIRGYTDWPLASGANCDDLGDWRPGLHAAERHGVRHPLVEAGFDKAAVRSLAAGEGLADLAELPASPCLSSRIETRIPVTAERLGLVRDVERVLRALLPQATARCRIRAAGTVVEIDADHLDASSIARLEGPIRAVLRRRRQPDTLAFTAYVRGSAFLHDR